MRHSSCWHRTLPSCCRGIYGCDSDATAAGYCVVRFDALLGVSPKQVLCTKRKTASVVWCQTQTRNAQHALRSTLLQLYTVSRMQANTKTHGEAQPFRQGYVRNANFAGCMSEAMPALGSAMGSFIPNSAECSAPPNWYLKYEAWTIRTRVLGVTWFR